MKNKLINFSKNIFKGIKTGLKELLIVITFIVWFVGDSVINFVKWIKECWKNS